MSGLRDRWSPRGRLLTLSAALVAVLLLVVGGVWLTQRTYTTDLDAIGDPGAAGGQTAAGGASGTLAALQRAVTERDPGAARALAPDGDVAAGDVLAAVVDNAADLRIADLDLRYLDELASEQSEPGQGRWRAAVEVVWRYGGVDVAPTRVETSVGFVADGDEVRITGLGDDTAPSAASVPGAPAGPPDARRTPVWLAGPVSVVRDDDVLVVAARSQTSGARGPDDYAALARAAVAPARAAVPDWRGGLVVEVPDGTDGLAVALGAPVESVAAVAAITAAPDGSTAPDAAVHVFLHGEVFDALGERGARLVMTHEAVHVATRAPASAAPVWLVEGFADLVAVRDVGVGEEVAGAQVARAVRRDGPPSTLPSAADFDTTTGHVGTTYEAAWMACLVLAEEAGDEAVLRVYERVDAGGDLSEVLPDETGLSVADLTARWQQRLRDLADRAA